MLLRFIALITLCLVSSCGKTKEEPPSPSTTAFTIPKVVFLPLHDHAKHKMSWNISEEISKLISERIEKQDKLMLVKPKNHSKLISPLSNFDHIKEVFQGNDFVIFMELIEHQELLKESSKHLEISLRLQIIDLKEIPPKVILREVVHDSHFMPDQTYFTQVSWKEEGYEVSPVGMAHLHFAKKTAKRIEEIILLAKK